MKKQTQTYVHVSLFTLLILTYLVFTPSTTLAVQKNLDVPFSSQTPDENWVEPWADACEETSTAMIDFYYRGYRTENLDKQAVKQKILELVEAENKHFGFNKDTNAAQMVELINLYLPWEAFIVKNPTVAHIKHEIDVGHPVIMPVHGRDLDNPNYKTEQVDYHVLVISGYDDETQEFITQEPATKNGLDYRYPYDTIMTAMHDFLPGDKTYKGEKLAVFTTPLLIKSATTDGDGDGLSKKDEKANGTSLLLADTNGDGFKDGLEVQNGYSPTVYETNIKSGDLIKVKNNPDIYLVENNLKRKILSMQVFKKHGWIESTVKTISNKFFETKFKLGDVINM